MSENGSERGVQSRELDDSWEGLGPRSGWDSRLYSGDLNAVRITPRIDFSTTRHLFCVWRFDVANGLNA